jgi:deazaflavin-dependent oxidoreductase (nitroreductase family)
MSSSPLQAIARHPASYRLLMKRRALIGRTEQALRRMSKDRIGVLDLVGLPSIQITVPGRKTGIPRTTPLQYVPDGDAFLVVGSNWGSAKHPAWAANLMAARQVTVRRRDEQFTASVRMLTGDEREQAWHKAVDFWPNYEIAHDLAGGRQFRLFTLERIDSDPCE